MKIHTVNKTKMGIRYLNKYIVEHCKESIKPIHLSDLNGKTIVIDISIYLYKYLMSNTLVENMYLMLSLFERYGIIPIFIFDGKPPQEKKDVLDQRYKDKLKAEKQCRELYEKMEETFDESQRVALQESMDALKKKCIFLKKTDINKVKELIESYGYSYYIANGEADELCAQFVLTKRAWACMSEDMDMFVYGVSRVLRNFNVIENRIVLYDTHLILKSIGITTQDFIELCIMTGSDYTKENTTDIYTLFTIYQVYSKSIFSKNLSFRKWLKNNASSYSIKVMNDDTFNDVRNLFVRDNEENNHLIKTSTGKRKCPNLMNIQKILEEDGFVYPVSI